MVFSFVLNDGKVLAVLQSFGKESFVPFQLQWGELGIMHAVVSNPDARILKLPC